MDMTCWDHIEQTFARAFAASPRDEWAARYAGKDVCISPVLDPSEVWQHPHIRQRFPDASAHNIPAAPAFSRTPISPCATDYCDKTDEILTAAGLSTTEIRRASPDNERQRMNAGGWPPVLRD
jgi:alpha-methylacyl-CoA racemase